MYLSWNIQVFAVYDQLTYLQEEMRASWIVININVRPQHSVLVRRTNPGSNPIVTEYLHM